MVWAYLVLAGLLEVAWAVGLKQSQGFTKLGASVFTVITMIASFWLLSLALRKIPLGTGYAVWVGIGVVGTAFLGILMFNESASWTRLASIALVLAGVIGLKVSGVS